MLKTIEDEIGKIMDPFVGEFNTDGVRENARAAILAFLETMPPPVTLGPDGDLDLVADLDALKISQGYLTFYFVPQTQAGYDFLVENGLVDA